MRASAKSRRIALRVRKVRYSKLLMNIERIAELLGPYLEGERLDEAQLGQICTYLNLLLKWNARMNLTSLRGAEEIVARHFGESVFAARHLFSGPTTSSTLVDVGSGAGFPGLPIAIARPNVAVTLIEAHGKKATFLKEVLRTAGIPNASVFAGRAVTYSAKAEVVTFRAVEHFEAILPVSAAIVNEGGRLAAFVGSTQVAGMKGLLGANWDVKENVYFPGSTQRLLFVANRPK